MKRKGLFFISGKITGDPDYMAKFAAAEEFLKSHGYDVINPAKVATTLPELEWAQYMKIDVMMLSICNKIYMLSDWKDSDGAKIELKFAQEHNMPILWE